MVISMNNVDIRELANIMRDTGLSVLDYNSGGESIRMERNFTGLSKKAQTSVDTQTPEEQSDIQTADGEIIVRSPMVGVFYSAPGADSEPYVAIGDTVRVGDVLCIIEAMKIMNEITAEHDGVITGICVENKQIVEFNQPLFRVAAQ